MEIRAFPADAGDYGQRRLRARSSAAPPTPWPATAARSSRAYQAGADYANGEFIQVHPTAIPGADKLRLMSESARGEGGRVWVPRQAARSAAGRKTFPRASAITSSKIAIPSTATSCRATSPPARSSRSASRKG